MLKHNVDNLLVKILRFSFVPMLILNISSGIVGGLWLLIVGEWQVIVYGIVLSVFMPFLYSIVLLPQVGALFLFSKIIESGNKTVASMLSIILSIYGNAVLVLWTLFVFSVLIENQSAPIIPLILWGYSSMMAPLEYMAKGESPDNIGTSTGILLAQLSFLVMTIIFLSGGDNMIRDFALTALCIGFSALTITAVSQVQKVTSQKKVVRILYIEDDPLLLKMFGTKFEHVGFSVDLASDGKEGLEKIKNNYYDVIVTGILLPFLSGIQILEFIRNNDLKQGSVLVLTNLESQKESNKALSLGAKEYLIKRLHTPNDVVEVVRKYI